MIVRSQPSIK